MRFNSLLTLTVSLSCATTLLAQSLEEKFKPLPAPPARGWLLQKGDRLAICGDSITEQKMYSRIMETYLTVAVPELEITSRQYGWSGETAPGFLSRMTNDVLRFHPTIATTCYGMNDHGYRPYEKGIGDRYRTASTAIVQSFKGQGARVIQGSPGCVGKIPTWTKSEAYTLDQLNLNLGQLRNIGVEIAQAEQVRFADIFWPMITANQSAPQQYGPHYAVAGKDGVHPEWAGQVMMAYSFLKAMGVKGDIGTYTVNLKNHQAQVSPGHELVSFQNGALTIRSERYPFCATGAKDSDNSLRSGMTLVPFNADLNRLRLVAKNGAAAKYRVTWGAESHSFTAAQLAEGINLAEVFSVNPFLPLFNKVDAAVLAKQQYETKQIKQIFHELLKNKFKSAEAIQDEEMKALYALRTADGKLDEEAILAATEKKHEALAANVRAAFVPVVHTLTILPIQAE